MCCGDAGEGGGGRGGEGTVELSDLCAGLPIFPGGSLEEVRRCVWKKQETTVKPGKINWTSKTGHFRTSDGGSNTRKDGKSNL